VAAKKDYTDRVTGETIRGVCRPAEIYKGSIAFIVLQVIMVEVVETSFGKTEPEVLVAAEVGVVVVDLLPGRVLSAQLGITCPSTL
jgi:hypothetical protein